MLNKRLVTFTYGPSTVVATSSAANFAGLVFGFSKDAIHDSLATYLQARDARLRHTLRGIEELTSRVTFVGAPILPFPLQEKGWFAE